MTSQIKDRARSANHDTDRRDTDRRDTDRRDTDGRDTDGFEATTALTAALTERARATAVANTHELQDVVLGVVRRGQDATLALAGMWTQTVRRPVPFGVTPARAVISGGYDLLTQLLTEQRRFVDALIDQQRRFAEALLTAPDHR